MSDLADEFQLPYFPNVTMGWDTSPRTVQSDKYEPIGYQYMATVGGNTPAEFETALRQTKALAEEKSDGLNIVTINAWNEWTEGSYLEPDTVHGFGYLEAIRMVFGPSQE